MGTAFYRQSRPCHPPREGETLDKEPVRGRLTAYVFRATSHRDRYNVVSDGDLREAPAARRRKIPRKSSCGEVAERLKAAVC